MRTLDSASTPRLEAEPTANNAAQTSAILVEAIRQLFVVLERNNPDALSHSLAALSAAMATPSTSPERPTAAAPSPQSVPERDEFLFLRESLGWRVRFRGVERLLPDLVGFEDLAKLMDRQGQEVRSKDLYARGDASEGRFFGERDSYDDEDGPDRRRAEFRQRADPANGDGLVDEETVAECRAQIEAYRATGTAEDAEQADEIERYLQQALQKNGEARALLDDQRRIRNAVRNRINKALAVLERDFPELYAHLSKDALKTGNNCSYKPREYVPWLVGREGCARSLILGATGYARSIPPRQK